MYLFSHFFKREKLNKLQSALAPVKRDFLLISEKEVLKVLQECKDAKVQEVLTGDYNLKLARQDYFTSSQDKVSQENKHLSWLGRSFFSISNRSPPKIGGDHPNMTKAVYFDFKQQQNKRPFYKLA